MRFSTVRAIFKKEILDLLRDRRAVISMVVVPLAVFPLLIGGIARLLPMIQRRAAEEASSMAVAAHIATPALRDALDRAGLRLVDKGDLKAAVENRSVGAAIEEDPGTPPQIRIYVDSSDSTSTAAANKIQVILAELKDLRIRQELRSAGLSDSVLNPFTVSRENVASGRKMSGALYGSLLGYMLVLLMFTGGMYPALDMTAGEKERKTLEALLASPARRLEIAMGKTLATVASMLATATLTLGSMIVTLRHTGPGMNLGMDPEGEARLNGLRTAMGTVPLDAGAIALIVAIFIPLALFAASLMFAIALKARSFREGQTYLTPLLMLVIFPALLGGLPGLKMTWTLCLIPIFNASQMIHQILMGEVSGVNFAVTLAANLAYAGFAFALATRMFEDETVLFRS